MDYRTDVIYHWVSPDGDDEMYFFSPDGVGRVFFDTLSEAKEAIGHMYVTIITVDVLED
jgi:hypothetical protein